LVDGVDQETGKVFWRVKDTFNDNTSLHHCRPHVCGCFSTYDAETGKRVCGAFVRAA
jgi:hypothetical protein